MSIKIGNKIIGNGRVFIIAEIGINHNGSLKLALELIKAAKDAGCDAVKFQKRTVPIVYKGELDKQRDVHRSIIENAMERMVIEGVQYEVMPAHSIDRLKKDITNTTNGDLKYALEFGLKEYDIIDRFCDEIGIYWSASSWDGLSAHFVNGFNVKWHKIASPCLTHKDLLRRVRYNQKPIILSTGGSSIKQIEKAVEILGKEDLIILHCVSIYPTQDHEANINVMKILREKFPFALIGYSGHEQDDLATLVAVKHGACVIERHITLDRNMPGSDHKASLEPGQFKVLVEKIRQLEKDPNIFNSLVGRENIERIKIIEGDGIKRVLPPEINAMKKLRRVDDLWQ